MIELWNAACLALGDILFGWMLSLPRDLCLMGLALAAAFLLVALRRVLSNQSLLRDIAEDEKTLRRLRRDAKRTNDAQAASRYRQTRLAAARMRLRQELKIAAVSFWPAAMMLTWMSVRLPYYPPSPGEAVTFTLNTPGRLVGEAAHIVPQPRLHAENGWVRVITRCEIDGRRRGTAQWRVRFDAKPEVHQMMVRTADSTFTHGVFVGSGAFSAVAKNHTGDFETSIAYRRYYPGGILKTQTSMAPGWLVVWLAITLAVYYGVKGITRTA